MSEFNKKLIDAYRTHRLPEWFIFEPYILYITGKSKFIPFTEIREMKRVAQRIMNELDRKHPGAEFIFGDTDDEFRYFRGYKEDAEIMAFLCSIDEELTTMRMVLLNP